MSPQPNPSTYADALFITLPTAILNAHYSHPHFRYTLPPNFRSKTPEMKALIRREIKDFLVRLSEQMDIDEFIDAAAGPLMSHVLLPMSFDPKLGDIKSSELATPKRKPQHPPHPNFNNPQYRPPPPPPPVVPFSNDTVLALNFKKGLAIAPRDEKSFLIHYSTKNSRARFELESRPIALPNHLLLLARHISNSTRPFTVGSLPLNMPPPVDSYHMSFAHHRPPADQYFPTLTVLTKEEEKTMMANWEQEKTRQMSITDRDRLLNLLVEAAIIRPLKVSRQEYEAIRAREINEKNGQPEQSTIESSESNTDEQSTDESYNFKTVHDDL